MIYFPCILHLDCLPWHDCGTDCRAGGTDAESGRRERFLLLKTERNRGPVSGERGQPASETRTRRHVCHSGSSRDKMIYSVKPSFKEPSE